MNDDEMQDDLRDALDGLDAWAILLDSLDGFVAATVARGYTGEQARALVISSFLRPAS